LILIAVLALLVCALAVIIVMLAVLFLGEAAAEWREGQSILDYGIGIALVIAAAALAVFIFQHVHRTMHQGHESVPVPVAYSDHSQDKQGIGDSDPDAWSVSRSVCVKLCPTYN
jgi:ABC-type uncharacterized transport system permease subunit